MDRPHALLGCLLVGATALPVAAQCYSTSSNLGSVTVLATGLPASTTLPNSTVTQLRIACPDVPENTCNLQISEPAAGVPYRGTIVFGSGAQGFAFYSGEVLGFPLVQRLQADGFRCVDRSWQPGWFAQGGSVRRNSCRYATLLQWVFDNVHTGGPFIAVGSSNGSSEVAYALTTWGMDSILDVAVLTGGPVGSRFDLQCPDPPSAAWLQQCNSLVKPYLLQCSPIECVGLGPYNLCTGCSANPTPAELWGDSILHPGAQTTFDTRVHQIIGGLDCLVALPSSQLFFDAIGGEKVQEWIPITPHQVVLTPGGREAVAQAIYGGIACAGPSTMAFRDWPQLGGSLALDLHGPPGTTYYVLLGSGIATTEVAPFGWLFLGPPLALMGSGPLDASGRATFQFPFPNVPGILGTELVMQGLIDGCLSNVVRFFALP